MAIYREDTTLTNPSPETVVMPGDVLLVMGEKEQVAHALRYLRELISKPQPTGLQEQSVAIRYAVDNGAQIINMSFGKSFSPEKTAVDDAVRYAEKKGVMNG